MKAEALLERDLRAFSCHSTQSCRQSVCLPIFSYKSHIQRQILDTWRHSPDASLNDGAYIFLRSGNTENTGLSSDQNRHLETEMTTTLRLSKIETGNTKRIKACCFLFVCVFSFKSLFLSTKLQTRPRPRSKRAIRLNHSPDCRNGKKQIDPHSI